LGRHNGKIDSSAAKIVRCLLLRIVADLQPRESGVESVSKGNVGRSSTDDQANHDTTGAASEGRRAKPMTPKVKSGKKRKRQQPPCLGPAALRKMAAAQGVKPIKNIKELAADFWPEEETADYIVATIRRWRREGSK
jgi:hypothetical protein